MKRILSLFLCCLVIFAVGCGKKKKDTNTITVWHWMTDRHRTFEALAEKYEEETGIKVKIDLYAPSEAYTHKIVASAQAKVLPDIYGILDKKEVFASFIEGGFVANLEKEFLDNNSEWEDVIFKKALDANRFKEGNVYNVKPGIYGVPLDVTNIQMLYNKKLLEKVGVKKPPATFEEFLSVSAALRRIGISSLVSGWGELWMINCFASNYAFNIMGQEKVMATFKGEVPYTDPDWIKVFNIFKELSEKHVLVEGIITKPNKFAEQDFALERAAFAFNGSWCVNVYNDMNPDLEYGAMLPPAISSKFPMKIWGGSGSSFVVNRSSVNRDKAIDFLRWLTAKDQQVYLSEKTNNLPSNRKALPEIPKMLSEFARVTEYTTHPTIWEYDEFPVVREKFNRGIQSIIIGEKTPEEVALELDKVKQVELKRNKKTRNKK